jgi:hypothetical protein
VERAGDRLADAAGGAGEHHGPSLESQAAHAGASLSA